MMPFSEFEAKYSGKRYEYVNGEPAPMGSEFINEDGEKVVFFTAGEGIVLGEIASIIHRHVTDDQLGTTFIDVGYLLQSDPPELRGADVGFIASSRMYHITTLDSWLPIAPDLVVRIAQEGVDAATLVPVSENGTRLLLVIDIRRRVIDVYRPNQPILTLRPGDVLDCSDVMTGFTVPVSDIFAVLD
jgi:hypothetical protein